MNLAPRFDPSFPQHPNLTAGPGVPFNMEYSNMETYNGQVRTPHDAVILFEACRIGMLPRVQRRLSEKERQSIRSGSVFVWDEREAGMRRWTDGKSWSASRVSGSFLTYREMEGKRGGSAIVPATKTPDSGGRYSGDDGDGGEEGPDGYRYKPDGLIKQSFSITTSTNQHLHLISYYSRAHPHAPGLPQPSKDPNLHTVRPADGLYPESAVNEQQTVSAVARPSMAGGSPYTMLPQTPPGHARSGVAHHPHSYAYHLQPHPFPMHAMPSPPHGYAPYPYTNGHGPTPYGPPGLPALATSPYGIPHYPAPPPIPGPHPPPNALDQRPSRTEDPSSKLPFPPLPPPPPPPSRPTQNSSPNQTPHMPTPTQPSPQPSEAHSPQPSSLAPIDPRLTNSTPQPAPTENKTNGTTTATETKETQPLPPEAIPPETVTPANAAHQDPTPNLLFEAELNVTTAEKGVVTPGPSTADLLRTKSPAAGGDDGGGGGGGGCGGGGGEDGGGGSSTTDTGTGTGDGGPADIPSQKLAFGEDKRALKALDKVFI